LHQTSFDVVDSITIMRLAALECKLFLRLLYVNRL